MYDLVVGPFSASIYVSLALLFGVAAQFRAMDGYSFLRGVLSRMEPKLGAVYAVALLTFVVSPLILNDVLVLVLTPPLLRYAKQHGLDPAPLVVAEVTFTNVSSSLTPIGNPQNILLWASSGIGFASFVRGAWPFVVASAALASIALVPLYRRNTGPADPTPALNGAPGVYLAAVALSVLGTDYLGLPTYGGLAFGFLLGFAFTRGRAREVMREFDLRSVLVLWALVAATTAASYLLSGTLAPYVLPAAEGVQPYSGAFVGVVSNIIGNVPATQLLIQTAGVSSLVAPKIAIEAGLAGNISPLASFANILALRIAVKQGVGVKRIIALQVAVGAIAFLPALL